MSKKYPRSPHVPWSPGGTSDDKIADDVSSLLNVPIVITEKIDGSNTCLEKGKCFARTHSGPPTHPSFDLFKALHASVGNRIDRDFQVFGEWAYALHSIPYDKLPGYFLMFGIRDVNKMGWLDWDGVKLWAEELNVPTVPVLFEGEVKTSKELQGLTERLCREPSLYGEIREGVVIRSRDGFIDQDFAKYTMKIVRAQHVQTSEHWKDQQIVRNKLDPKCQY